MDMRAENGGGGSAKQPVCQEPKRSNRKPKGGVTVTPEVERKVLLIFPDQDSVINALDSMMTSRNDGSGLLRDEKSQLDIKLKCLRESQHYQESSDSELKQMWFLATQRYKENPEVKAKLEAYEDTLKNERDALLSSEFLQHFPPNLFMRMLKEMTDTRGDIGAVGFEQQIGDWQKTVQVRAFRTEQTFACMHEQQLHKLWNGAYNYYKTHPTATEIENQKIVDFEKMIEAETALSPILKWRILLPETEVEIQRLQAMVEKATTLKQDAFSDHESGEQIEIHNIAYLQTCKASDRNSKRIEEHREKLASHTAQKLVLEKKYMCILDGHYSLALRGAGLYASLQEQFESIDGQQGESGFVKKEAVLEDHGWANFEDFEFLHALHESWKIKHQAQPHQDHGLDEPLKLALDFNSAHGCWKPDDALEKLSIGGILFVQITSGKMKTGCAVCVPRSNPHDTRTRITDIVAFSGDFKDCFPFGDIWSFKQNAENSKLASIKIKLRPGVKVEIETVQNQPAAFVSVSQTALQGVHHHILSQMQNCVELCLRMMEPESNQTCRRCAMPWRFLGKQCSQCSQKIPPRLKQKLSDYLSHVKLTTKSLNDSIEKCPFFLSCLNFDAAIDRMLKIMAASGILHFDEGLSEINWNASCNPQIFECFLRNMERSVLSDYESMICDSFLQLCSGQNFIWPTLPPRKSDNVSKFFEEARWPDFLQKVYFKMIEISNVPLQQNGCAHVELGGSEANAGVVDTSSSQARTTCLSTDSELRELGTRLQQFFDVDKKNDQACPIELAYLFCCFACGFVSEDGFVFLDIDAFNYDLLRERTMRALKQKQESHRCLHYDCKARNELERSKVIQSQAQRFSSPGDTAPENKTMKKIPVFQFKSQEPLQIWHEFVQISLDQAKPNIRSHKLWRRARFVLTETDESTSPLCVSITFLPSELLSERISSTKCYATVVRCNSAHTTSEHQRKYSVEAVKIDYVGERFQVIAKVEHIMMVIEDESAVHRLDIFTDKNEKLDSFFIEFHDRPLNMLKSSSLGHFPGLFAYNCLHENDVKISVKFRAEIQRYFG